MPATDVIFQQLGISLLLGLLVGLQREHAEAGMPGLRTFPLITLFGTAAALLAKVFGGWLLAAGLVALTAILAFPNIIRLRQKSPDPGMTTNAAVLLMYAVGALVAAGPMAVAVVLGGVVAVLLQFKPQLHRLSGQLGDADLQAIMKFVLITCIILPVLPRQTLDPFNVLSPFEIWLVVVLIVGISLGGYIAYKFLGQGSGMLLGGVLGGAISSTATTVSYARQSRDSDQTAPAAIVIMIASTVLFVRILVEMAVVSTAFLLHSAAPMLVLMLLTLVPALLLWRRTSNGAHPMPQQRNPTQLRSALLFGAMYALILFALAAAKQTPYAQTAMVPLAVLSGIADLDALNLSTARLSHTDPEMLRTGWRLVVVAVMTNMVFKTILAGLLGSPRLLRQIAVLYAVPMLGAAALLAFWP